VAEHGWLKRGVVVTVAGVTGGVAGEGGRRRHINIFSGMKAQLII